MENTLNLNVGILGHVDSGKTSLAKRISQIASTASFDKNPQSQERGITIDLGFSSLKCPIPDHLKGQNDKLKHLQFTFVDCPGHASLLRTVIGGAQIIDMIILVLDICKGIQTQTAECLVLGEVTCSRMVVVLNKIDMIPEEKRASIIQKVSKKMQLTLRDSVFKDSPIVSLAANPGGSDISAQIPVGIDSLIEVLKRHAVIPERSPLKPFLFAVDHCFGIRGQGTVITGTVLQGSVSVGDVIEIPSLKLEKKVKSMQMFRQNVTSAHQGDRLGICVKQLDSNHLERGIICAPSYSSTLHAAIIPLNVIKYFKSNLRSNSKFHISIGYETVIGRITIFRVCHSQGDDDLKDVTVKSQDNIRSSKSEVCNTQDSVVNSKDNVCNTQFSTLKTLQPPNGTAQGVNASNDRKTKVSDQLRTIKFLFKRLRVIYEKCNENCQLQGMEYMHIESLIPLKEEWDMKSEERKTSESYRLACDESKEVMEQVALKNRHLKEVIDQLRRIISEINTMLMMRRS